MQFVKVDVRKTKLMEKAVDQAAAIRAAAARLVEWVAVEFNKPRIAAETGLVFHRVAGSSDVRLVSPFGDGRLRLLLSAGDEGIEGRYLVERKVCAVDDSAWWETVWALRILAGGQLFMLGDDGMPPREIEAPGSDGNAAEWARYIGLSIEYALAAGAQTA